MKRIYQKTDFPEAPGGDRYEWKEAEIIFKVPGNGRYLIAVTASCKNGGQNGTGDDDDLKVSINGYEFGREEVHPEQVSYQGFGTSAAWDGASLKGGAKMVYFFMDLDSEVEKLFWPDPKREHIIQFYADRKPQIKNVEVFQLQSDQAFTLKNLQPLNGIDTKEKGIPWVSCVFLSSRPRSLELTAQCRSGRQKGETDGDNIKVILNGNILQNPDAPTSDKYKNFYFSGDQLQGKTKTLILKPYDFPRFENAVELWYDEDPVLTVLKIEFFETQRDFFEELAAWDVRYLKNFYSSVFQSVASSWERDGLIYASQFLRHSLKEAPQNLTFDATHPIVDLIKKDVGAYNKILELIKERLREGKREGEIITGGSEKTKIDFEAVKDLRKAIHGIKKITYKAKKEKNGSFEVDISLFDIYDFDPKKYGEYKDFIDVLGNNMANRAEDFRAIRNYQIEIRLKEKRTLLKK